MKQATVLLLIMFLSVLIFIASNFNEHLFKVINYLFFMSFIITIYAFYLNENRAALEERSSIVTSILTTLADIEANPTPPPSTIILLMEKIQALNPGLAQPDKLGERIERVMAVSDFNKFWRQNHQYYDPSLVQFISPLLPPSPSPLPHCTDKLSYPIEIADGFMTDNEKTAVFKRFSSKDRHLFDKTIQLAQDGIYSPLLSTCVDEDGAELVTMYLPVSGEDILDENNRPRKGWETAWMEFTGRLRRWLSEDKNRRLTGVMEFNHHGMPHSIQRFSFRGDHRTSTIYICNVDVVVMCNKEMNSIHKE